jgi:hypothetical protein
MEPAIGREFGVLQTANSYGVGSVFRSIQYKNCLSAKLCVNLSENLREALSNNATFPLLSILRRNLTIFAKSALS